MDKPAFFPKVVDVLMDSDCNIPMLQVAGLSSARSQIYVRDCYPMYYDYVMALLNGAYGKQYVIVGGTEDIGKSMFYNWFFHRYRADNPSKTIVCASFTSYGRACNRCTVFGGSATVEHFTHVPQIRGAMYLFDGPPPEIPLCGQMIVFSMYSGPLNRALQSFPNHVKLYIPVWSLEELMEAARALGLKISDEEMSDRFEYFGGSARYCLSSREYTEGMHRTVSVQYEYTPVFVKYPHIPFLLPTDYTRHRLINR